MGPNPALVIFLRPWRERGGPLQRRELRVEVPLTSERAVAAAWRRWDGQPVSLAAELVRKASGNLLERNVARSPLRRLKPETDLTSATKALARTKRVRSRLLGTLTLDRDLGAFEGRRRAASLRYSVSIAVADPDNARGVARALEVAEVAVKGIERALPRIRETIAHRLLATYNQTWREGGEPLSPIAFQRRHVLESVDLTSRRITLFFECGQLFADHVVEVRMSPRLKVTEVCLAG